MKPYGETPTHRPQTTMTLFAAAAHYGWYIAQADAVLAYLNGKLENPVYMRQPTGFEQGEKNTLVCKLNQALYGLEPSARIWYDTLSTKLKSLGFRVSAYDPALWIHTKKPNLYVTSHVDDFEITGPNRDDIQWVLDTLGKKFDIKDLGQMKRYLGMDVLFTENGCKLTQSSFIDELVRSVGMERSNPVSTPLEVGLIIDDPSDPEIDIKEYQRVTGSIQWLATHTRPDIARAASLLAQFNSKPTQKTVAAQKRLLRYLNGTRNVGINFPRGSGRLPEPVAYTDADWGGPLTSNRRSVSGYIFKIAGGPISWRSHRQTSVALSSNEAEYMAASDAAREAEWLWRLVIDMNLYSATTPPMNFYIDNRGAEDLIRSEFNTKRSKHIDIRYHYVRDIAERGIINIVANIGTKDMAADGFTKPLAENQ